MSAILRTHVMTPTIVQSASIGVLGAVIHPLLDEGDYTGTVFQDGVEVLELHINVDERHPLARADIDLSRRKTAFGTERRELARGLRPGGHLVLFSSGGRGGYHVCLHKGTSREKASDGFDSRSLGTNDLFSVTLMRPGVYEIRDELGKGTGRIKVAHAMVGDAPTEPLAPVDATVTPAKLDPADIGLQPGQRLVLAIHTRESAITIKLVAPDNGQ